ncbi:MAG: aldo/keto reductase [Alphaproteobacteria bacterium]|nr:aldo/keto reductase [Alphaproteobacteria bacterium]
MDYRLLGRSGLKVSTLAVGTMTFGNIGAISGPEAAGARRQIDMCWDKGVNIIDTANIYAQGKSEEIIGEVLSADASRDKWLLATKVRFTMGEGPNGKGLSRHHIIAQCEQSLRRLRTDRIDLYQVHEWDGQTPLEETMEALDTLVKQGKVRYVGCSNYSGWHIMKALRIAGEDRREPFVSQQIHYSLYSREAEYELLPISADQGLGVLVWSPLAGGLLSGKYTRDGAGEGRHATGWKEPPLYDRERLFDIVDAIVAVAGEHGVSGAQVALAWLIQRPTITSVIIGGRTDAQFADNLAAADLRLTRDQIARLDAASKLDLIYPYWHQNMTARDRLGPADMVLHDGHEM